MEDFTTYYEVLEIAESASYEEMRTAYRRMAQEYHPDRVPEHLKKLRRDAEEKLKQINEAWAVLGNPVKRQQYDAELKKIREEEADDFEPAAPAPPPPPPRQRPQPPPPPPPRLVISQTWFDFTGRGPTEKLEGKFTVSMTGGGVLQATVKSSESWLGVLQDQVATSGSKEIEFRIDSSKLQLRQTYSATIGIQSNIGNADVRVSVSLDIKNEELVAYRRKMLALGLLFGGALGLLVYFLSPDVQTGNAIALIAGAVAVIGAIVAGAKMARWGGAIGAFFLAGIAADVVRSISMPAYAGGAWGTVFAAVLYTCAGPLLRGKYAKKSGALIGVAAGCLALCGLILVGGISLSTATIPTVRATALGSSIRAADFSNFDYSSNCSSEYKGSGFKGVMRTTNGQWNPQAGTSGIVFSVGKPIYGDLIGDGHEEAIIPASCGYQTGNGWYEEVFIYGMRQSAVSLLSRLSTVDWGTDSWRLTNDGVRLDGRDLLISYYAGGSHAQPAWVATARFRWNGSRLARIGVGKQPFAAQTNAPEGVAAGLGGNLTVHGPSGAEVVVDGTSRGSTDEQGSLLVAALPAGSHSIIVRKTGYKDQEASVQISAGHDTAFAAELPLAVGKLTVQTIPGAMVAVDGSDRGAADAQGYFAVYDLPAGTHQMAVRKPGYSDGDFAVDLAGGETKNVPALLNWSGGYLTVHTSPSGTTVNVLLGVEKLTGAWSDDLVPTGTYTIIASHPGMREESRTVLIQPGQHATVEFNLAANSAYARNEPTAFAKNATRGGDPSSSTPMVSSAPAALLASVYLRSHDLNQFQVAAAQSLQQGGSVSMELMHEHSGLSGDSVHSVTISLTPTTITFDPGSSPCKYSRFTARLSDLSVVELSNKATEGKFVAIVVRHIQAGTYLLHLDVRDPQRSNDKVKLYLATADSYTVKEANNVNYLASRSNSSVVLGAMANVIRGAVATGAGR